MAYGCTITVDTGKIPSSQSNFAWLATEDNFPTAAIDGGATSILNGGGNLRCYTDDTKATQLPIEVVTFVTGGTPSVQVWGLSPSLAVGGTVYIEADSVATTQPAVTDTYGRNAVWVDYELVIHGATTIDSTGTHSPSVVGSPTTSSVAFGDGYNLDANTKWVQIPHAATLNIEKNYSIDFWVNPSGTPVNGTAYIDKVDSGNSTGFRFLTGGINNVRTRHPNLSLSNLDSTDSSGATKRLSSDMDGTTRRNIINGASAGSDTPTGVVTNNTDDLYIGHSIAFPTDAFNGVLGDFWISSSSRALSKKESEYNNQSSPSTFWTTSAWIDLGGGITVTAESQDYNINFYDAIVDLSGEISVAGESQPYNVIFYDAIIDFTGEVLVDAESQAYQVQFYDAQVSLISGIEVQAQSQGYDVTFFDASVQLSGEIIVSAEDQAYSVTFYDAAVSITELWTDKPKAVTNWTDQAKTATIWTDK